MRYGVISDIHANLDALNVVLRALRRQQVDAIICAGDLVGYGPFPNECVELVAGLGVTCVAGNHDLMALGRLPDTDCVPLARVTMQWTREVLSDDARRYLGGLPINARVDHSMVMTHGSLDDPRTYLYRPEQAIEQLDLLASSYPGAGVLIVGHTHIATVVSRTTGAHPARGSVPLVRLERTLINPGSVGQSRDRDPAARFAIVDLGENAVTFFAEPYDVERCRRSLRERGLPPGACHQPPLRFPLRGTALRRLAGRAFRATRQPGDPL